MRNFNIILFSFFLLGSTALQAQIVGIGISAPKTDLHLHDSLSTTNFLLTQGSATSFGLRMNVYSGGNSTITGETGELQLKAGNIGGLGTELKFFDGGHIAIGKNPTSASNFLHIQGSDPLRLEGLTEKTSPDSVLVLGIGGVVHKAHVSALAGGSSSYWSKLGNRIYTLVDSVGIGRDAKHILDVYSTDDVKANIESDGDIAHLELDADIVNFGLRQYGNNYPGTLLTDNISAKSLSTITAENSIFSLFESKGLLLNVESDKPMIFATDDTEQMRLDSLGQLGIGTNSPKYKLHVEGDIFVEEKLKFDVADLTQMYMSGANLRIESQANLQLRPRTGYDVSIYEGGSEYATFDANTQSLGIGVISPEQKLDVIGNIQASDSILIFDSESSITKSASNLVIRADNALELRGGAPSKDIKIFADNTEWAVFDGSTQNLGVGTLTPNKKLDVNGSAMILDSIFITDEMTRIYKDGSNLNVQADANLKLRSGGGSYDVKIYKDNLEYATFEGGSESLGLGTTTPREKIDVIGNAIVEDTIYLNNYDHSIQEHVSSGNLEMKSNSDIRLNAGALQDVSLSTNGTVLAMFKGSTQNVGIGTLSPSEKLEVNGTIQTNKIKVTDGAIPGYVLISDGSGLATWGPPPPDGDWIITGLDMQAGIPGNIQIGIGGPPQSKLELNGSFSKKFQVIPSPTYVLTANDNTVIMAAPGAIAQLPPAASCPGREYVIKFLGLTGGLINTALASDLIDGLAPAFTVPGPLTAGLNGSIITLQSDGIATWFITNIDI